MCEYHNECDNTITAQPHDIAVKYQFFKTPSSPRETNVGQKIGEFENSEVK